ncbi:FecR family protein [Salinispira pacifica]
MRRNGNRWILGALLALTVGVVPAAANGSGESRAVVGHPHGVVQFFDGDVSINGSPVDFGQVVQPGDRVQTGKSSSVDIIFNGQNIIHFAENTIAVLNITETAKTIDMKTGTFSGVFAKLSALGGTQNLQVRTPTAYGGVRGTTFFVKVIDQNDTYICACHGVVDMQNATDTKSMEVKSPKHEAFLFKKTDSGITVSPDGMLYHTSEDLNKLADKINFKIDWGHLDQ